MSLDDISIKKRLNETITVLIDVIMQVTINLEPFNGTISFDHYGFNPCQLENLYWNQLNGKYEDIIYKQKQPYFTTCVSNSSELSLPSRLEANCHKIDNNVSFHSRSMKMENDSPGINISN